MTQCLPVNAWKVDIEVFRLRTGCNCEIPVKTSKTTNSDIVLSPWLAFPLIYLYSYNHGRSFL